MHLSAYNKGNKLFASSLLSTFDSFDRLVIISVLFCSLSSDTCHLGVCLARMSMIFYSKVRNFEPLLFSDADGVV